MKIYRNIKYNFRGILFVAGIGIVIAILAIIAYLNFDLILKLFGRTDDSHATNDGISISIPYIDSANGQSIELFYENSGELSDIVYYADSYVREFRVISISENRESTIRYTLTKSGDKYRAESDTGVIIYNDGTLLNQNKIFAQSSDAKLTDLFEEIGITSPDELYNLIENSECSTELLANGKVLNVKVFDSSNALTSEYNLALETGIILNETHYFNGSLYLKVTTDNLIISDSEDIDDQMFTIPN